MIEPLWCIAVVLGLRLALDLGQYIGRVLWHWTEAKRGRGLVRVPLDSPDAETLSKWEHRAEERSAEDHADRALQRRVALESLEFMARQNRKDNDSGEGWRQ